MTIAGQTAPGGGIGVRSRQVTISGSNIVFTNLEEYLDSLVDAAP